MKMRDNRFQLSMLEFKLKHPRAIMVAVMFLLIPIASSLIIGYEMKDDVASTIPTVVMDSDNSSFSQTYLDYVNESDVFEITAYTDSYEEMEKLLYEGKAFCGIVIPENFYSDLVEGKAPVILTLYDGSSMSVVTYSKNAMTEILLTLKGAYLMNIYQGKQDVVPEQVMNMVQPIQTATRLLYSPTRSLRNFLIPGMLAAIVQVAMAIAGAEAAYLNQTRRMPFVKNILSILQWSVAGTISMFLTLGLQWIVFGMPLRGNLFGFLILTELFSIVIVSLGYIMGSIFPERAFCSQISCILVLPTTILGGYTWPVLAMPANLQPIARALPFCYYGDIARGVFLKPLQFHHMLNEMEFMAIFFAIEVILLFIIKYLKFKKMDKRAALGGIQDSSLGGIQDSSLGEIQGSSLSEIQDSSLSGIQDSSLSEIQNSALVGIHDSNLNEVKSASDLGEAQNLNESDRLEVAEHEL